MKDQLEAITEAIGGDSSHCTSCNEELVICPMCDGSDNIEGGQGQQGFNICQNDECKEFEVCCGC